MGEVSRRDLLRAGAIGVAALAMPGAAQAATSGTRQLLRRRTFLPHVGTTFVLTRGGKTYRARLLEITDWAGAAGSNRRFGLTFRMIGTRRPPGGIYRVTRAGMPAFNLFAGPIGERDAGLYEVIVGG